MTTCDRCGSEISHEELVIWNRLKDSRTRIKHLCVKCDAYMFLFSEPAYLPGRMERTRLDAYIESLEAEKKKKPKEKIKDIVGKMLKDGYTFKRIGEETGMGIEGAMLVGAEIREEQEEC